jgi:hypothetical protein
VEVTEEAKEEDAASTTAPARFALPWTEAGAVEVTEEAKEADAASTVDPAWY